MAVQQQRRLSTERGEGSSSFADRPDYGNFEANVGFLEQVNVLDKTMKILEIGSGKGRLLNYLVRQGYDVRGVDIDKASIDEAKLLYGGIPIQQVSNEELPFENASVDVAMSFDVFEHIPNSDRHLREVSRVLRLGGYYLLQTPNKWTNTVFETIRWRSFTKWRKGHCSLHSYWEVHKRFGKHGFEIKFHDIPVVNEFFLRKIRAYLGSAGVALVRIVNPDRLPRPLATNFYICARKFS